MSQSHYETQAAPPKSILVKPQLDKQSDAEKKLMTQSFNVEATSLLEQVHRKVYGRKK